LYFEAVLTVLYLLFFISTKQTASFQGHFFIVDCLIRLLYYTHALFELHCITVLTMTTGPPAKDQ
jgi:hypothetical protein